MQLKSVRLPVSPESLLVAVRFGDQEVWERVGNADAISHTLWPLFAKLAKKGVVTGRGMMAVVEEAGLVHVMAAWERHDLEELVAVSFSACCAFATLGSMIVSNAAADDDNAEDDSKDGDAVATEVGADETSVSDANDDTDGRRLELSFSDFVKVKLGLLSVPSGRIIAVKSPLDSWRPRSLLLTTSAVVIIALGIAVTTCSTVMWMQHATDLEESSLARTTRLMVSLSEQIERSFVAESAGNMVAQSVTSTKLHASLLGRSRDAEQLRQRVGTSLIAAAASQALASSRFAARVSGELQARLLDALVSGAVVRSAVGASTAACTRGVARAALSSSSSAELDDIVAAFEGALPRPWQRFISPQCAAGEATAATVREFVLPSCAAMASHAWQPREMALETCDVGYGTCHRWTGGSGGSGTGCLSGSAADPPELTPLLEAAVDGLPPSNATSLFESLVESRRIAKVSRALTTGGDHGGDTAESHLRAFPVALWQAVATAAANGGDESTTVAPLLSMEVSFGGSISLVIPRLTNAETDDTNVCDALELVDGEPYPKSAWMTSIDACNAMRPLDPAYPNSPLPGSTVVGPVTVTTREARAGVKVGTAANRTLTVVLKAEANIGRTGKYVVMSVLPLYYAWLHARNTTVIVLDHLNFRFSRTTELVVGGYSEFDQDQFVPQMNTFRFGDQCFEECSRTLPSTRNMVSAITNPGSSGWSMTPDYRPYPCVGAYAYLDGVHLGFVMERDVRELRQQALQSLVRIVNSMQSNTTATTAVEAFHFVGAPPMPYFLPSDPCPPGTDCRRTPSGSLYFEYACQHCDAATAALDATKVEFLSLLSTRQCGTSNCTRADDGGDMGPYFDLLQAKGDQVSAPTTASRTQPLAMSRTGASWSGLSWLSAESSGSVSEAAMSAYIANLSVGIRVSFDLSELYAPLTLGLGVGVGVAALFIVLAVLMVLVASNSAMDRMDEAWSLHQSAVKDDVDKFNAAVRDVVPPDVIHRLLLGESVIAERQKIAVVAIDFCGFSKYVKEHPPAKVARLVLYARLVFREVAADPSCDLLRLHTYGDTTIYFAMRTRAETEKSQAMARSARQPADDAATARPGGGLNAAVATAGDAPIVQFVALAAVAPPSGGNAGDIDLDDPDAPQDSNHPVCRAMRFATGAMGLFSDEMAHFPNKCPAVAELFEDLMRQGRRRYAGVPPLRIACHFGVGAVTIADHTNAAGHLEVFGHAVATSMRLVTQTNAYEIGVTTAFRDALRVNDSTKAYTFSDAQRLVTRGGGTTKHILLSWKQREMSEVQARLGITVASADFPFDQETQQKKSLWTVPIDRYTVKPQLAGGKAGQGGLARGLWRNGGAAASAQ